MTRERVLALIGDAGRPMYSAKDRYEAIDLFAQSVMQHEDDSRSMALDLVSGMLDDGSIVLMPDQKSFRFEKGIA